ncbi:hypothetical protein GRF61_04910 [Azoarcus sp. TTM-91]|uniref:hypothetical protein n=1 Tax=Azoarcus sp. TTM-91 TaxID=2691581 RepID=UPI00145D1A29|nr:hypothetical protein [Azoarcus sp. TTM-91]NMG33788.1 hypothetical protein [Azoarcus sp. TTM-91]
MKGNYYGFSNLENSRYSVVTGDNVIEVTQFSSVFAGSNSPELFMAFPYLDLVNKLKQSFSVADNPTASAVQQYRNHLSTLNGYLAFCGKTIESNVGTELAGSFDAKVRDYLESITVAPRTRRDRRLHLQAIQKLYQASLTARDTPPPSKHCSLGATLRLRIAETGVAPKTLAKQAGVDPTTLWRWLKGATPRADTLPALRRLEVRLGLTRDALVNLIEKPINEQETAVALPSHRLRMAERPKHNLPLPESALGVSFLQEWRALFDYKISDFPTLERQPRGHWRLIPQTVASSVSPLAQRGTMVCPTASMFMQRIRTFLGVLTNLPPENGGITWYEPPPQTLAWCAHPQALECFLQWITSQSDGIRHNGQKVFARAVSSLLRPQTGFLWQQAAVYRVRLPEGFRPASDDAWREMCAKSHKFLRDYIRSATSVSRNPAEPIANLLNSPNPLKPIRDAIVRIDTDAANSPPGSISEARHKRNALVLALLLSNPMRVRTLASLTWMPDGHGTVRGSPTEGWRIQLQPVHLKTGNSKQSRGYSVKVADWVKPMMDEYIEEYRETLLAGKASTYLLVGDEDGGIWEGLSRTVRHLTRRYIPGSPGFGPHAMRHLVATDWLRKHPGDFLTVAELLNDNLTTVLENYAHLRRDDSFSRYEAYLDTLK